MSHEFDITVMLAGALSAALTLGFVTQRIGLSPIVGYLAAGVLVGPFTPGFVAHPELATQFAELGIVLLMFGIGLNFHLKELFAVRKVALPGALAGLLVSTALGAGVARLFAWPTPTAIVFGLTISIASTVVLVRVLSDHDILQTRVGHVALGWLTVEDLFTVLVVVVLPSFFGPNAGEGTRAIAIAVGTAVVKVALLIALVLVLGQRAIPVILRYVAKTKSRELFTLTVLALALGIAAISAKFFGASMALGAFLGGMVVGQSEFSSRAASEALPMRDAFAVLFFVSVGMLFNPGEFVQSVPLTIATLLAVLVGKPLVAFFVMRWTRHAPAKSLTTAVSLAQIGEFSFVLAALGRDLHALPPAATQALVATAIASITLNPLLFRAALAVSKRLGPESIADSEESIGDERVRTIVIGYGPVGQTLARLLRENDVDVCVVELNHDTVDSLNRAGMRAVYGDAAHRETLVQAGVAKASSLIFAASGSPADSVVSIAKELNPKLKVLARSAYLRDVRAARAAGADHVVAAEAEVAIAMTERLMSELGATREQLDRARDRVREEVATT